MSRMTAVVLYAILSCASPVAAQSTYDFYDDHWGIDIGLTPSWKTADPSRFLFKADRIDLQGSEFRFGFVRGRPLGGDWGMSFVNKAIDENSTLDVNVSSCSRGDCGTFYRTLPQTRLTGLEFHQFVPFKTWRERIQLGMTGSIGVAWMRGTVYKRMMSDAGVTESFEADAKELFPPSSYLVPLMSMEIAGASVVAEGLKVRASGGFSMPGYHKFSMTFIYLIPKR